MPNCCEDKHYEINAIQDSHKQVLWFVLMINIMMFVIEGLSGLFAHSTALLADALDMFGDALVYGFSLFVLSRSSTWQVGASLVKGIFMLGFGLGVLIEAIYKAYFPIMPDSKTMLIIGSLALFANCICFFFLYRHRDDNLNMSSTWLCSRNDLIANIGVLFAASFSHIFYSRWPDILIGGIIALIFLRSAINVFSQSLKKLKTYIVTQK